MIIEHVNSSIFVDRFRDMGRESQFSYGGKIALFDYLEDLSEDTGEAMELDVIALCCEFTEYKSAWEAMEQYQPDDMPTEGEEGDDLVEIQEKNEAEALSWLQANTQVIEFDGGVIIQDF